MKKSVLLIDDDGPTADSYSDILKSLGYSVEWIGCPRRAMEVDCMHSRFSHVIVDFDYNDDEITGEDVGRFLRRRWELMPLILLTAWLTDEGSVVRYGKVEWDALLSKQTPGESGNIDDLLVAKLEEAGSHADSRISFSYPISQDQLDEAFRRLNALERAYSANGGKSARSGQCNDKEALQAACIFLSREGQSELSSDDIKSLQTFRSKSPFHEYKSFWSERNVEMTRPSAWYPYFRFRENVPTGEVAKLTREGLCMRRILTEFPDNWKLSRKKFKQLSKLIKEFGISD